VPRRDALAQALVLSLGAVVGCGTSRTYVWASQLPGPTAVEERAFRPGDKVQVVVETQTALSGEFDVRPGGDLVLPTTGVFQAAGKLPEALAVEVANRLRGVIAEPRVTIVLVSRPPANVSVLGEVGTPGHYQLGPGENLLDLLARAGGLSTFADEDAIFLIRRGMSTPRIRFRYSDLLAADPASLRFMPRDGDVLVVE
jgi:polysaccharide export outer membrane protein